MGISPLYLILVKYGSKLYRQNVGIPMITYYAPLVAESLVVMDATMDPKFFKPEKNLEFFRLKKIWVHSGYPGRLE